MDSYLPLLAATVIVIAFVALAAYAVSRLYGTPKPGRVIAVVIAAITGLFSMVPAILQAAR